jgi:dTDP-4-amino-4,6-dideoxygalactose transaminase
VNPAHRSSTTVIPFFDLTRQTAAIYDEIAASIDELCRSGRFILGPACELFEQEIAELCGVRHAIGCASCSDALLLALMAVGIRPEDEVLVPAYTFFSPAGAIARLGARPVFVDIDPTTFTIDATRAAEAITPRTKAIIAVHLFGHCAAMKPLKELSRQYDLIIIEDAAQAIGAGYGGEMAGGLGDIGCFSFFPTKNLGCFGDGGMLTTNDDALADRLRLLRVHGMRPRYRHRLVGINSRLDTIQAAILRVKMRYLEKWTQQRSANAARYDRLFSEHGLDRWLNLPKAAENCTHVWNQYVVRVPSGQRDRLREHLSSVGIGTEIYYPEPLPNQPCFAASSHDPHDFTESNRAAAETLALPIFPELTSTELNTVVVEIANFAKCAKPAEKLLP